MEIPRARGPGNAEPSEEQLDVVDMNNQIIGQEMRGICHARGEEGDKETPPLLSSPLPQPGTHQADS